MSEETKEATLKPEQQRPATPANLHELILRTVERELLVLEGLQAEALADGRVEDATRVTEAIAGIKAKAIIGAGQMVQRAVALGMMPQRIGGDDGAAYPPPEDRADEGRSLVEQIRKRGLRAPQDNDG